jgi:hypothetical protein
MLLRALQTSRKPAKNSPEQLRATSRRVFRLVLRLLAYSRTRFLLAERLLLLVVKHLQRWEHFEAWGIHSFLV